jgi:AraC-like DNA-binding protein
VGSGVARGLNETGEDAGAYVVRRGAAHASRTQRTSQHAHYAWKIHVGIDAPVWVRSPGRASSDEARVVVVPPNVTHATGAVGWSVALFIEPGSRGAPWRESGGAFAIEGASARRLVRIAEDVLRTPAAHVGLVIDEVARATFDPMPRVISDARVRAALAAIEHDTHLSLVDLAASLRVSVDRLTHLVSTQTGMPPRRHALWQRVLRVLDAGAPRTTLASAAVEAGFADHAHMTRTFRRFLGRVPSEFRAPPTVVAPWRSTAE